MAKPIRDPAVAGLFYPADARKLRATVGELLDAASGERPERDPKVLIVPHAGYVYSGAVAASAYATLAGLRRRVRSVLLLGPSHRVAFQGIAVPTAEAFATPLGRVEIDTALRDTALQIEGVCELDEAHRLEHSLEVQLPFLQSVLDDFRVLPLVVGDAAPANVATVIERLWGGSETLIVVSSDLSHYHDYSEARRIDSITVSAIERASGDLRPEQACGSRALNGLALSVRAHELRVATLDVRNSGDTAGPRDRVVGYGAFALFEDHSGYEA